MSYDDRTTRCINCGQISQWEDPRDHECIQDKVKWLKEENSKMREALEFYANPSSWLFGKHSERRLMEDSDLSMADEPQPGTDMKGTYVAGKLARQCLKGIDGDNK